MTELNTQALSQALLDWQMIHNWASAKPDWIEALIENVDALSVSSENVSREQFLQCLDDVKASYELEDDGEEQPRRLRRRTFKKFDVMLAECERYVEDGKRLPKLHSRWLYREFRQCHTDMLASIEPHNRMVDELRVAKMTVDKLQRRIQELEAAQEE